MKNSNRPIPLFLRQNNAISKRSIRIRLSIALIKNNSVYLLKSIVDGKEAWFLPGGSIKWGESLTQCLKREVLEELRINVSINRVIGVLNVLTQTSDYHSIEIIFSGKTRRLPKVISETNESNDKAGNQYSVEGRWFKLSQLKNINAYPEKIIKKALYQKNLTSQRIYNPFIDLEEEFI